MRQFVPPNLQHPRMKQRIAGSMFTPAIAAWSSPGAMGGLGALGDGLPSWSGYAVAAGLLGLAAMRKLPWWLALGGAAASVMWLGASTNILQTVSSGTGIVANSTTLQLSAAVPGTLITTPTGAQSMQVAGITYPLITIQNNPDGTVTYFLDNPT